MAFYKYFKYTSFISICALGVHGSWASDHFMNIEYQENFLVQEFYDVGGGNLEIDLRLLDDDDTSRRNYDASSDEEYQPPKKRLKIDSGYLGDDEGFNSASFEMQNQIYEPFERFANPDEKSSSDTFELYCAFLCHLDSHPTDLPFSPIITESDDLKSLEQYFENSSSETNFYSSDDSPEIKIQIVTDTGLVSLGQVQLPKNVFSMILLNSANSNLKFLLSLTTVSKDFYKKITGYNVTLSRTLWSSEKVFSPSLIDLFNIPCDVLMKKCISRSKKRDGSNIYYTEGKLKSVVDYFLDGTKINCVPVYIINGLTTLRIKDRLHYSDFSSKGIHGYKGLAKRLKNTSIEEVTFKQTQYRQNSEEEIKKGIISFLSNLADTKVSKVVLEGIDFDIDKNPSDVELVLI